MSQKDLDFYFGDLMPVGFFRIDKPIERDILKDFVRTNTMKTLLEYELITDTFEKVYVFK